MFARRAVWQEDCGAVCRSLRRLWLLADAVCAALRAPGLATACFGAAFGVVRGIFLPKKPVEPVRSAVATRAALKEARARILYFNKYLPCTCMYIGTLVSVGHSVFVVCRPIFRFLGRDVLELPAQ